jgi:hypothetical protein
LLQDCASPAVEELLGFSAFAPVHSVYAILEEAGALSLLHDAKLPIATQQIITHGKTRGVIDRQKR